MHISYSDFEEWEHLQKKKKWVNAWYILGAQ